MLKVLTLRNQGNKLPLILALLLGLLAAMLTAVYLSSAGDDGGQSAGAPVIETASAVVAAEEIPAGTQITADMVTVKSIPTDLVIANVFQVSGDVVGKVALVPIVPGEQIMASRVVAISEAGQVLNAENLADTVPIEKETNPCEITDCGLRAVSVRVAPATAAAGLIRPGDQVDVIDAFNDGSALTVVTDVEVLALDTDFERVINSGAADTSELAVLEGGEGNPEAATATLALWPSEAQKVAAAEEMTDKNTDCQGSLRLSLRHTGQPGTFEVPVGQGYCAYLFALAWGLEVGPVPEQLVPQD